MAAPTVAGRNTTSITTATDPWTVNLPASIAAGDLLIAFARMPGTTSTFLNVAGWNNTAVFNTDIDATDDLDAIMWKIASGTEGATFSWDLFGASKGAVVTYRITGHNGGIDFQPAGATYTTTINTANSPATGTMPSDDYMILALTACGGEAATFTAPTNYVNVQNANSGTAGATTTNCRLGGAERGMTAITSEDPGVFTHAAAVGGGTAYTLAIRQLVTREADLKQHRMTNQAVNRGTSW